MFGFVWTNEAFQSKRPAVFPDILAPAVPLMVSVVFSLGLGSAGGTLLSRYPWFDGLWVVAFLVVSCVCVFLSSQALRVKKHGMAVYRVAWWTLLVGIGFATVDRWVLSFSETATLTRR